ncbi:MAG: IS110 family transposase [Actinobacteria bacterium]|nr:IS110 family transposase [Actinomycetota bacterium]
MTNSDRRITGGVDAHADTHDAAALDERGRLLGARTFPTDPAGQRALLKWLEQFGELAVVGVESTGSYAAGLVRYLRTRAVEVVEVNRPHAHARRRRGKSDPIDAEMAARQALAGDATAVPKLTTGIVESIRQLRVARDSAVKARSAALCQLTDLIVTAPDELRDQLSQRKTTRGKATLCSRLRPRASRLAEPAEAGKFALRSLARRIAELYEEITALDEQLATLVATAAPRTTQLLGISTSHAGQLLVTAGQNIERLANDGAFAALCGASPIPVSSGRRNRHRLNPGGDRDANRTLHMIAVVRLRYCQRTRAYAQRRITEGKTKPEIIRCLKRYIARETYHTLCADLADLTQPPPRPATTITINCGAGPLGRTRRRS